MSSSRRGTLLYVFLLLGICIGIVTATAREPKIENESFGTSSILWWRHPPQWWWHHHHLPSIGWWWHPHPKKTSSPTHVDVTPSPSPVDNATSPTLAAPSPSRVDNAVLPTHVAPSPSPVDNVASPTHAAPSPSRVDNATSPPHAAPSPSPVDNVASTTHAAPSPVDDVVLPPHTAPTTSCIKVDGCALDFISSVFKHKISLSTQCCRVLSTISDDCFYREFTHSKRVPFFLRKVRSYCSHKHDQILPRE